MYGALRVASGASVGHADSPGSSGEPGGRSGRKGSIRNRKHVSSPLDAPKVPHAHVVPMLRADVLEPACNTPVSNARITSQTGAGQTQCGVADGPFNE
jgi:hypothetical protein